MELVSIKLKFEIRFKVKNILCSHLSVKLIYVLNILFFKKQTVRSRTDVDMTLCSVVVLSFPQCHCLPWSLPGRGQRPGGLPGWAHR